MKNRFNDYDECCGDCRYFCDFECKRYPPSIGPESHPRAPFIATNDWCGEYKKAKSSIPKDGGYLPRENHENDTLYPNIGQRVIKDGVVISEELPY